MFTQDLGNEEIAVRYYGKITGKMTTLTKKLVFLTASFDNVVICLYFVRVRRVLWHLFS
jgi:hypothetical protein